MKVDQIHQFVNVTHSLSAEEVKAFRVEMGWTQIELATRLGVSKRAVEVWESPSPSRPPHYLRLAFAAMAAGLAPWAETNEAV
jgi:DNA-binding transcriptional regulator YiaG